MKTDQDTIANLQILINGVAALNAGPTAQSGGMGGPQMPPQMRSEACSLLEGDLLAFRRAVGLDKAWPEARAAITEDVKRVITERKERKDEAGRQAWKNLHERTLKFSPTDSDAELKYLAEEFPRSIPGCSACRTDYGSYLGKNPPALDSSESYFAWGVALHNYVNQKPEVNKRVISLLEAKALWG